jgi:hypothetical protein
LSLTAALKAIAKPREGSTASPTPSTASPTPPATSATRTEKKLRAAEAELDAGALIEPSHAGGEHEECAPGRAELKRADTAKGDLIARRKQQLVDLRAAWDRADSAVRQTFVREVNTTGAPEWPVDD